MLSTRNEGKVKGDSGQIKTSSRSNLLSGLVTLALGIDKRERVRLKPTFTLLQNTIRSYPNGQSYFLSKNVDQ